jgi:hypothetical protein
MRGKLITINLMKIFWSEVLSNIGRLSSVAAGRAITFELKNEGPQLDLIQAKRISSEGRRRKYHPVAPNGPLFRISAVHNRWLRR